jgi:opacity protein-like surface antigen
MPGFRGAKVNPEVRTPHTNCSIIYSIFSKAALNAGLLLLALAFFTISSSAQDSHKFTADIGGGVTPLTGAISDRLNTGWNFSASGGYNFTSRFSASIRYSYNGFGLSRLVLNEAAVPDGSARLWGITLDPKVRFSPGAPVSPYIVGGVGYFRRTVEFTQPTLTPTLLFDPFFGFVFPALVPVDQVIGTISRSGIGGNLGLGSDFRLGHSGLKVFAEARYQYADTGRIPTRSVPITFGIRW